MDEDVELAASGACSDVALRMPPPPGQRQTLPNPMAPSPDERPAEPSGASLSPAAASGATLTNPSYHPGGAAGDPLAASGPPGLGGRSGPLPPNPGRPAGGPGRPGIAASMPAAVARGGPDGAMAGGAERRRDARSAEALGAPDALPCARDELAADQVSGMAVWLPAFHAASAGTMSGHTPPCSAHPLHHPHQTVERCFSLASFMLLCMRPQALPSSADVQPTFCSPLYVQVLLALDKRGMGHRM